MTFRGSICIASLALSFAAYACVGDDQPIATTDAGTSDASTSDSGASDAGGNDAADDAITPVQDAAISCTAPTVVCGDKCVTTSSDSKNCGRCGHDCLGGACTDGVCTAASLAGGHLTTNRIRTDGDGIYWLRRGNAQVQAGIYTLAKKAAPNTAPTEISKESTFTSNYSALEVSKTGIYYHISYTPADRTAGIYKSSKLANAVRVGVRTSIGSVSDIALTSAEDYLAYAIPTAYGNAPNGEIHVYDLTQKVDQTVGNANQANPTALAIDGSSLYWLNGGTYAADQPSKNGGLYRISVANPTSQVEIAKAPFEMDLRGLEVRGATALWTSNVLTGAPSLRATTTNPGSSVNAFLGSKNAASLVTQDGTNVYWVEKSGNDGLYMCPLSGCPGSVLPAPLLPKEAASFTALYVDADAIYFAKDNGYIFRLAKP